MPLQLVHRPSHRAAAWQIVVQYPEHVLLPCPGHELRVWSFRLKRDAQPYYEALTRLPGLDWTRPIGEWPTAHQDAVRAVLAPLTEARATALTQIHARQVATRTL